MSNIKKALEAKLSERLAQHLKKDLMHEAMVEIPELVAMDNDLFWQLRDELVSQAKNGGIQVIVKLPSNKALAQQKREAKVK